MKHSQGKHDFPSWPALLPRTEKSMHSVPPSNWSTHGKATCFWEIRSKPQRVTDLPSNTMGFIISKTALDGLPIIFFMKRCSGGTQNWFMSPKIILGPCGKTRSSFWDSGHFSIAYAWLIRRTPQCGLRRLIAQWNKFSAVNVDPMPENTVPVEKPVPADTVSMYLSSMEYSGKFASTGVSCSIALSMNWVCLLFVGFFGIACKCCLWIFWGWWGGQARMLLHDASLLHDARAQLI